MSPVDPSTRGPPHWNGLVVSPVTQKVSTWVKISQRLGVETRPSGHEPKYESGTVPVTEGTFPSRPGSHHGRRVRVSDVDRGGPPYCSKDVSSSDKDPSTVNRLYNRHTGVPKVTTLTNTGSVPEGDSPTSSLSLA